MIWWVAFLFIIGILLILAEFILPGLICGILGAIAITLSCAVAVYFAPEHAFGIVVGEIVAVGLALISGFFLISRSPLGKKMVLEDRQDPDAGWVSDRPDAELIGRTGQVFTQLRPAGTVLIDGKKVSAVSTGSFVEAGATVRVVEVRGNRIVVEPAGNA